MTYERRSEAQKHKEDAHAAVKMHTKLARDELELALDWAESWPNEITNLEADLESLITKIRVLQRNISPEVVEGVGGRVRMTTDDYDLAETRVVKIQDVD